MTDVPTAKFGIKSGDAARIEVGPEGHEPSLHALCAGCLHKAFVPAVDEDVVPFGQRGRSVGKAPGLDAAPTAGGVDEGNAHGRLLMRARAGRVIKKQVTRQGVTCCGQGGICRQEAGALSPAGASEVGAAAGAIPGSAGAVVTGAGGGVTSSPKRTSRMLEPLSRPVLVMML